MSTPEQPATPPLTRKQMREIRNTGSNPVIPPPSENETASEGPAADASAAPELPTPPAPTFVAPLPRPATPAVVPPPPVADSAVDLGVSPLTRRQARQQERIRTASVPVITPEIVAAHAAHAGASAPIEAAARPFFTEPDVDADGGALENEGEPASADTATTDSALQSLFGPTTNESVDEASGAPSSYSWAQAAAAPAAFDAAVEGVPADALPHDGSLPFGDLPFAPAESLRDDAPADDRADEETAKAVVNPLFGAGLLGGSATAAEPAAPELPASFDQLLSRSTGSISAPNALIVSQAPEIAPLVAPVTATGEVILTGTFNLPEGLGSMGHAKGTADGKEIDATLIDGELPSHSSPTPIAASAAVSTVKTPGEVIRPPVPEKGSRLMMSLAITAGVLALALVGVLILAFVTGVF